MLELIRDTAYSLVLNVTPRLASALLFILIGRLAEPSQAGVFSLAVTYLLILSTLMRGLDDLLIRQVSREPEHARAYWISFSALRLGLSMLAYGVLVFTVLVIVRYARSTVLPILILALSLVPDGLAYVAQSVLIGQRQFGAPAVVLTGVSLFQLVGGSLVLALGGGLQQIAWVWVAGSFGGVTLLQGITLRRTVGERMSGRLDWNPLTRNWQAALSFFFILFVATMEMQLDVVILSAYRPEADVGWYFAATTIMGGVTMLSRAYWQAAFPLLTRLTLVSPEGGWRLFQRSVRYMGALIVPIAAGLALLAPRVIDLVFGSKFQPTSVVLQLISLALMFMFLSDCNSRVMQVNDRQTKTLWFVIGSLTVNVLLNLALDPLWGPSGAAWARIGSAAVYFLLSCGYVKLFLGPVNVFRTLAKPVGASLVMAPVVWLTRAWPLPGCISLGVLTYGAALYLLGWLSKEDESLLRQGRAILAGKLREVAASRKNQRG